MGVLCKLLGSAAGREALLLYRKYQLITEQRAREVPPESDLQMRESISFTSFFHEQGHGIDRRIDGVGLTDSRVLPTAPRSLCAFSV